MIRARKLKELKRLIINTNVYEKIVKYAYKKKLKITSNFLLNMLKEKCKR